MKHDGNPKQEIPCINIEETLRMEMPAMLYGTFVTSCPLTTKSWFCFNLIVCPDILMVTVLVQDGKPELTLIGKFIAYKIMVNLLTLHKYHPVKLPEI